MKHFIVFFHILSFLVGFTGIILSVLTYIKYKISIIKSYNIFIIALTTILLGQTITSYNIINTVQSTSLTAILNIASYTAVGFIIYFLPLFVHEVIEREWTSKKKVFFKGATLFPILSLIMYYTTSYKNLMNILSSSILFLVIFYALAFICLNYKYLKNDYKKRVLKSFLTITILFFPYMYLDTRSEQILILSRIFPYGLLSLPLFYMLWNLLSIYFIAKYYKDTIGESYNLNSQKDINESHYLNGQKDIVEVQNKQNEFFEKFNITNREKEIILLLAKGNSYNQLAEELSISLTTVKTHVHNIYRKAEVKNKIQLINLINGDEPRQNQDVVQKL
ncbi:LuxR family transcriptional regulator [Clostridium chromiireducens]|uniref:LuxR family transcriptional regulator n=1 Tax=Clostridium chromiireducens TaxID=225345 RepID=A0A399IS47_9CLOT|nr:helix-turn-helix transcriptional regulator [Clostridium chromiireducens]RII34352.1 LuxR family transcriptional regulator [Clostridium chromiireducens]